MPSLDGSSNNNDPTVPFIFHFAEVTDSWGGDWQYVPYLEVLTYKRASAPEVEKATFQFATGYIKREDDTGFQSYTSFDLRDYYIRILIQYAGGDIEPIWTGIVVDQEEALNRADIESGNEIITAYGLSHLLDREVIGRSWFNGNNVGQSQSSSQTDQNSTATKADWVMEHNLRPQKGHQLKGNRSGSQINAPNNMGTSYVFSSDGNLWANTDIINYLLTYHTDPNIIFNLTGQTDSLDDTKQYYHFKHMTTWKALNMLIKDKKGLGFRVEANDNNEIDIRVFSHVDYAVQVGPVTLPANNNQISLNLPDEFPYDHLPDDIPLSNTATNQYKLIVVRGARAKAVLPFGYQDKGKTYGPLKAGWQPGLESAYRQASSPKDEDANDQLRSGDKYDDVYRKYVVPTTWDGTINSKNVLPIPQNDGTMSFDSSGSKQPVLFMFQKQFSHTTPFKRMVDYSQSPPADGRPDTTTAEFQKPLVFYYDGTDGDSHTKDKKWHFMEKLKFANTDLQDVTHGPCDNTLGIKLHHTPNHYLALNNWTNANPSNVEPEIDAATNMMVVAMFETDARQRIILKNPNANSDRVLVVDVDAARYIYTISGCPCGINDDGTLKIISDDNLTFDDDHTVLQNIAAMLAGWYSKPRQSIEAKVHQPGYYADIGAFLVSINMVAASVPIGTPVTSVSTDVRRQTTTVRTGYLELDYLAAGLAGRAEDLDD